MAEAKKSGEPGWAWRKVVIFPNIAVSFWLLWVLAAGRDTKVNETIAWGRIV